MRIDGKPPLERMRFLINAESSIRRTHTGPTLEEAALVKETFLVSGEVELELGINPFIGWAHDLDRVKAMLGIIGARSDADPQDILKVKEQLLKDGMAAVKLADQKIRDLAEKHGISLESTEQNSN